MANAQKYTRAASGHLAAHFERRKDEQSEYVKFGNQDIDPSRTHLNYNLAPEREGGQMAFIRQRTTEARTLKRDDVNVMVSWVVTLPEYRYHNPDLHVSADKEKVERAFFERTYRFLCDRYGEQNVISAYVHMDEKTPHMHFAFVPVTEDKKRGGEKVSAKDVITRADLKTFHMDLERHLDSFHDWHFEVINEATKDGNKTVAELKKQTAHEEVLKAQQEAAEARQRVLTEQERIKPLQEQQRALEAQIRANQEHSRKQRDAYDKNTAILERQRQAIEQNNDIMQRQAKMIELINSDIEYQQHARELNTVMDGVEANLQRLPQFSRLFKEKEARSFVADFLKSLRKVMDGLQAGINRLIVWETRTKQSRHLSEPLEERKESLLDKLARAKAESKAQAEARQPSKGHKKEGPIR